MKTDISRVVPTTKNGLGKAWDTVWIPYHDGVDGAKPISSQSKFPQYKDSNKESLGLSWKNGQSLLDRATFNKWEFDGTPQAKPHNMHIILLFNIPPKYTNYFRRYIQKALKDFKLKAQLWKSKLQKFPDPSQVGFIIYSANTLQVNLLVKNVLSVIKKKKNSTQKWQSNQN